MTSPPYRAAIYGNGTTPLFLDTAEITFTFADGPSVTSLVEIARVDYERNLATVVFREREAIEALALHPHFHTAVSLGELRAPKRAEETNPDFEIAHEMQIALHAISGSKEPFDPYSQLEALVTAALKDRRRMLRAEEAIAGIAYHARGSRPEAAREARSRALTKLAALTDAQALSVIEGNRIPDPSGRLHPAATINDVRNRRTHLRAAAQMMRRLAQRRAQRPFPRVRKQGLPWKLQRP